MKLPDFKTEQWMNNYETKAKYNMTDTCVQPLTLQDLISMDTNHDLEKIKLDYGTITGDFRLKQGIVSLYQNGTIDNVTLTHGCLEANQHVMDTILEKDDVVVTFTPGYQQFVDYPKSLGCIVKEVPLIEENHWQMDFDQFQLVMEQQPVKMIIINSPNNPTGTLFEQDVMDFIILEAEKNKTWILSDEVYQGIGTDEVKISDIYEYGISTSSLSKLYSCAGLRLGWIKGNEEIIQRINVRRDYTMISTGPLIDTLGNIILEHKDELIERSVEIVKKNQEILSEWLQSHSKFSIEMPSSGTVGFLKYESSIRSTELAKFLLFDEGVFFVPGSCFDCENHLRIGFTAKHEDFAKGLELLGSWMESNG